MPIHDKKMASLRCTDLPHAIAEKLQFPSEYQSNFCRDLYNYLMCSKISQKLKFFGMLNSYRR